MSEDYVKAHQTAKKEYKKAVSEGRYPYLPALDDFLDTGSQKNEISLGVTEIPLWMVAGTKTAGRQTAFSPGFMPLLAEKSEFASKWSNLCNAQLNEGLRDPILAYEYMNRFYVQEGNKRVSVLKYVGAYSISASVTRILPEKNGDPEVELYYEFVDFYQVTHLFEITFSEKGRYAALAKIVGFDLKNPWPDEAVEKLKSAFLTFSDIFEAKGGNRLSMTGGDAFLLYLEIYSLESLLYESKDTISKRLSRIWKELLTQTSQDSIELLEVPEDAQVDAVKSGVRKLFSGALTYTENKPLNIAFLYERSPEDSRWVYGHELGRLELEDKYDGVVKTRTYVDCMTDDVVEKALEDAKKAGCQLIFTTSASMMAPTLRFAIRNPSVSVLNCSVNLSHNAVRTYHSRMYEAKFLMGALGATISDSDVIGYVADMPAYGLIANINAFAIGAALVRPKAKILLKWSTQKGVDWKQDFTWENISTISGPDFIRPDLPEREYGLYQNKDGNLIRLAAPIWQWGKYYDLIVGMVLDGSFQATLPKGGQSINYWYGMSAGVIDVILSQKLSPYSSRLMKMLRSLLIKGELVPFEGSLRSQDGVIRAEEGTILTSEEIIRMDWLNDNIIGEIPETWKLYDSTKNILKVSGVMEE